MTTQQVTYFLALAQELHYWKTSYKMNITQSALSRQIKGLEEELNLQLFKRSNRKVELTPAGAFLQQQWKPLLEQIDADVRYAQKINQGEQGTIVISHPGSISYDLVPDVISLIAKAHPDVKVELIELKSDQEVEFMKTFQGDLTYSRSLHETDFLSSKLVRKDHLSFVLPEKHPIRKESDLTTALLQKQRYIIPKVNLGDSYPGVYSRIFKKYGITPEIRFESDFGSTILSLVQRGLGISIMPYSYSLANHPGVRFLSIPFVVPLYLYWRTKEESLVVKNILKKI